MAALLLIKTGTSLPALVSRRKDYDTWIRTGLGVPESETRLASVYLDEPLPPVRDVAGAVISGSSAMVTDRADWSERTAEWLREAVQLELPILGICYGHQLLAHALGGVVEYNPYGRHIGTVDVTLREEAKSDRLFGAFREALHVPVSHRQAVTKLPDGAVLLAEAAGDPIHAFRVGKSAWGVQFHPEFDANIVRGYIEARRDQLLQEGLDADALWENAMDSADGTILLRRFADVVRRR
ncbi:MAG TPA: glutamine amidotransferase [Polyangiales bacterium]|nr:glutamine amidotransferase [Polyangiales bacterium]